MSLAATRAGRDLIGASYPGREIGRRTAADGFGASRVHYCGIQSVAPAAGRYTRRHVSRNGMAILLVAALKFQMLVSA